MYSAIVIDTFDNQFDFYSDFHKDVYGFRPRHDFDFDVVKWEQVFAELQSASERALAADQEQEAAQVALFEASITAMIDNGAGDRATAIRWYAQGENFQCDQDVEFWLYKQGLLHTAVHHELVERLTAS